MFDSHAHVSSSLFQQDRSQVIARAKASGVKGWIEVGTNIITSHQAIALAQKHNHVFAAIGFHPHNIDWLGSRQWNQLNNLSHHQSVVAIGEIGFDYHHGGVYQKQLAVVKQFIHLALSNHLPIIWHLRGNTERDANADLINLLQKIPVARRPSGVVHTFSGTVEQAKVYANLGLYLGISGVVTFKNAGQLVAAAAAIPLNKILIETDCPYLTPEPYRGQRNEPSYVKHVATKIADIKGINLAELEKTTDHNVKQLFRLSF